MKRILITIFMAVLVVIQVDANVELSRESMRFNFDDAYSLDEKNNINEVPLGDLPKSEYLVCFLLLGAYVVMKRKRTRL